LAKSKKNQQQGYQFRGIDDVYNAASPLFAKNHLSIFPRVLSRETIERSTSKGSAIFYVTVFVEFDIVCSLDGSSHKVSVFGEASDMADKATNKAMSAAMKYMCLMTFMIPTESEEDADLKTHDNVLQKNKDTKSLEKDAASPKKYEPKKFESKKYEAEKTDIENIIADANVMLEECEDLDSLKRVFSSLSKEVKERVNETKDKVKARLCPVPPVIADAFPDAAAA
jgi:hypothetical protein